MNCPDCDAAMLPVGNHPHFHCPSCGHFHFPDDANDGATVTNQPVGAACPVCHLPLQSALIEEETVCYCDTCRGFLAPIDAFGRIVGKRRSRHGQHEQRTNPFDPAELRRALLCPDCGGRMDAHPYSGGGNAVVDTCEACALIWLDADELAVIERYVPHQHQIERTLTLPGATPISPDGVLGAIFLSRRRSCFPLDELLG
jgi:Zn-finger nucleic acid-binding protein